MDRCCVSLKCATECVTENRPLSHANQTEIRKASYMKRRTENQITSAKTLAKQDLTVSYSVIQMLFWMELVTISGYAAYYLLDAGMSNTQVGVVLALGAAVSALLQPSAAAWADRPQSPSLKRIQMGLSIVMFALGILLLTLFHRSFTGTVAVFFLVFLVLQLEQPFLNSLGSETIDQKKKLNFGAARAFGSIGYMILAFILGRVTEWKGAVIVPAAVIMTAAGYFLSNAVFPFEKSVRQGQADVRTQKAAESFFTRYRAYMISLVGCVCLSVGHVYINSFLLQIVQSKGGGSGVMGNIMSLEAGIELSVMFGYSFLARKLSSAFCFRISGVFFTLKVLATLLAPDLNALYLSQLFQPFAWGLIQVSSVYFINSIMAPEDKIKGQALFTSSHMIATVIGSLTGGFLLDHGGVSRMLLVGTVISAVGTILLLVYGKKAER